MRYDPVEEERRGCMWKLIILTLLAGGIMLAIYGAIQLASPLNYSVSTTYNYTTTNNFELNILSGNTDTIAAVGICTVLVLIVRTLGRGIEKN